MRVARGELWDSSRLTVANVLPRGWIERGVVRGLVSMDVSCCDLRWLQQENPACDGMATPPRDASHG